MGDHPKQVQGDRLIGVGLQYPLINTLGLGQATCSVVLNGEVQGFLDVWRLLSGGTNCGFSKLYIAGRLFG